MHGCDERCNAEANGTFARRIRFWYDEFAMLPILFENEEIIIIDKPAGLPSQPGEGVRDDVIAVLERQRGQRFLPVHRLDKETSGCMILAKDAKAARRWSELVSGKLVSKRYFAWVAGKPDADSGDIDTELEGSRGAQRAKTLWSLKETWSLPLPDADPVPLSLLEIELKTGRMHQIRRHLAGVGLPILADDRHGDFALNKVLRRTGIKRLMLWARELVLPASPGTPGQPGQPDQPGGASILSSEPPHFAALREMLTSRGCALRIPAHHNPPTRRFIDEKTI